MHAGLARHVDDPASLHRDHLGKHELRREDHAAKVHVERRPPIVRVDLPQRTDRADDARVVDEEVDRAESPADHADRLAKIGRVGDVGLRRPSDAAGAEDRRGGLGQLGFGTGDHPDGDPCLRELDGHHPADAPTTTRDDCDRARLALRFAVRVHGPTMRSAAADRPEHGLLNLGGPEEG